MVEGRQRARLIKYQPKPDYVRAEVQLLEIPLDTGTDVTALFQTVQTLVKNQKDILGKTQKEKLPLIGICLLFLNIIIKSISPFSEDFIKRNSCISP